MGEYVNSQNARFDKSHISCGVVEIHHLPKGERKTAFQLANHLYHKAAARPAAFVIFSDLYDFKEPTRGQALASFLERTNCGTLVATTTQLNPKTGNPIRLWTFTPDHEKFRKWYTEETMHRLSEE